MDKKYIIAGVVVVIVAYVWFATGKDTVEAPVEGQKTEVDAEASVPKVEPAVPVVKAPAKNPVTTVKSRTPVKTTSVTVATTPSVAKDGSYLVSYTASGFVPPVIEIQAGKSVHFVNESNKAMSVTSQEPNSQVFGELNQGKSVSRGGFYDFTFLQPGAWKYMNRNNSLDTGVIVVK